MKCGHSLCLTLSLVLAVSFGLCGCGGKTEANGGAQEQPVEEPAMEPAEPADEEAAEAPEEPKDVEAVNTLEYSCITVRMPARYEAIGLSWVEYGESLRLEYAYDGNRVQLAEIDWDERARFPYEVKEKLWYVGLVTYQGSVSEAYLHVAFVDADGKTFYGGLDVEGAVLAPEYYLGLSAEEILSWLETNTDQVEVSTREDGLSTRTSEFYGVWAYASKDLGEAVAFADDARNRGFDAEVFLTTDWDNLNPEPWYVVSLGCSLTEAGAVGILENAFYLPTGGYDDAYIKYSGAYIG